MTEGHAHKHATGGNERSLTIALALTTTFLVVELVGGILTHSLALISDAAHMFTDTAALGIALAAIRVSKRIADKRRTFGYHRFEILAAAFNAMLLFGVAVYIVYEAYLRLKSPPQIQSTGMLAIAVVGLVVNLISMRVLVGGREGSLNVKGAYLEVWSDMLGSIGVIVGAILIKYTGWVWVDSAVAILIGLWVLPRTWTLLKSSINILLEGVPEDVDLEKVKQLILSAPGVISLHDLHVWALTSGKTSLTTHLVHQPDIDAETVILPFVRKHLAETFAITHITVQCELRACEQTDGDHHFGAPGATSKSDGLGAHSHDAHHQH